ncbi:MAG: MMPL family transporter [Archangium sp.]|nr:MMPL family transporter [Archangium sp.]MDP3572807.1 MMPL family transporter [Archangium sp.]
MKRVLDWLVSVSSRHPWRFVAISLVVAVVASAMSSQLGFRGDFTELLPKTTSEVKDLKEIEDRAGGTGYLMVQVLGDSRENRRAFAKEAAAVIEARKDVVRFVEWRFDTEFLQKRALLLLGTDTLQNLKNDFAGRVEYEKKIANPLYVDLGEEDAPPDFETIEKKYSPKNVSGDFLESKDGDELYLLIKATSTPADLDFNRKLIVAVKEAVAPLISTKFPKIELHYTGAHAVRVEDDDAMQADLQRSVIIAAILTLAIILAISRRLAIIAVVAFPVGIGITSTFAFTWVLIGHLNPVTGFLGAILIGLGIEFGLHLSMRYWEERRKLEPIEAMRETLHGTFGGALSSAVTNAAAFFVLVFAEFEAFKQFGRIAAFGVVATLASTYFFGPALLFLSERFAIRKPKPVVPDHVEPPVRRPPTAVLIGIVTFMALAVTGSLLISHRVGFETNLLKLTGESKAGELEIHIAKEMGVIMIPGVIWVDSLESARKVSQIAKDVQKERGEESSIAQIASLNDLLPADTEKRLAIMAELGVVLDKLPNSKKEDARVKRLVEMTQAQPYTIDELPTEFRRRFEPFDHQGTFVLLFPRFGLHDVRRLEEWAADLNTVGARADKTGLHAPILDANRLAAKIFSLIRQDGPLIMGLASLVVFFTIWIALKKFTHALMVTGPLFAGMACLPGGMFLGDISLNFLNVVVLPNLLAIAVDNSVHVFHRYKEDGIGSMPRIMKHTGLTAVVATCSNAAGYASMLIARHAGLRSVGLLAVVGVVCTFLGTTILFPALLELRERILKRGLGKDDVVPRPEHEEKNW